MLANVIYFRFIINCNLVYHDIKVDKVFIIFILEMQEAKFPHVKYIKPQDSRSRLRYLQLGCAEALNFYQLSNKFTHNNS